MTDIKETKDEEFKRKLSFCKYNRQDYFKISDRYRIVYKKALEYQIEKMGKEDKKEGKKYINRLDKKYGSIFIRISTFHKIVIYNHLGGIDIEMFKTVYDSLHGDGTVLQWDKMNCESPHKLVNQDILKIGYKLSFCELVENGRVLMFRLDRFTYSPYNFYNPAFETDKANIYAVHVKLSDECFMILKKIVMGKWNIITDNGSKGLPTDVEINGQIKIDVIDNYQNFFTFNLKKIFLSSYPRFKNNHFNWKYFNILTPYERIGIYFNNIDYLLMSQYDFVRQMFVFKLTKKN